jgi:integrase/recombinase XerD
MSPLRQALTDYLSIRRSLGYKLGQTGQLLHGFVDHLEQAGIDTVTIEHAVAWSTQPTTASIAWWARRLSMVRGFATYLAAIDPATEVPPRDLLPRGRQRATPFLYSEEDLAALLAATGQIRSPWLAATFYTLIGLLAVTGLRIGEAIALNHDDLDRGHGLLLIRSGKFGKARQLPLHPTTTQALTCYLEQRDTLVPAPETAALFVSTVGRRLHRSAVNDTFRRMVARAGLEARPGSCRPRIHDLRHSFAVASLLETYRSGADVHSRLPLLSTYLGHAEPESTYWYLSAAPELLALAGQRLDDHLGGRP